jgi:hypothetical protein
MHCGWGFPRRVSRHDRSLPGNPPSRAVLTNFYSVSATLAPVYLDRVRGREPGRPVDWLEGTMEPTLEPGRHETIKEQDTVHKWRVARLARLGIPRPVAEAAAGHVDWPDGSAGAAGLPPAARTPHPPLM